MTLSIPIPIYLSMSLIATVSIALPSRPILTPESTYYPHLTTLISPSYLSLLSIAVTPPLHPGGWGAMSLSSGFVCPGFDIVPISTTIRKARLAEGGQLTVIDRLLHYAQHREGNIHSPSHMRTISCVDSLVLSLCCTPSHSPSPLSLILSYTSSHATLRLSFMYQSKYGD